MTDAPRQALDLTRYHARHVRGDITAYLTWWLAEQRPLPCLVLIPTGARSDTYRPAVVSARRAWIWSEEIGDPCECARLSVHFAVGLGFSAADHNAVMRITSIIRDHIDSLIFIPPMPTERCIAADVLVQDHATGKVTESVVTDRV